MTPQLESAPAAADQTQRPVQFLDLPGEIKVMIYRHLLPRKRLRLVGYRRRWGISRLLELLLINKQISKDIFFLFQTETIFSFHQPAPMKLLPEAFPAYRQLFPEIDYFQVRHVYLEYDFRFSAVCVLDLRGYESLQTLTIWTQHRALGIFAIKGTRKLVIRDHLGQGILQYLFVGHPDLKVFVRQEIDDNKDPVIIQGEFLGGGRPRHQPKMDHVRVWQILGGDKWCYLKLVRKADFEVRVKPK